MKFNNEINNILKNAGIQLNESYIMFGLDKVYDNIIKFHNAFKDKNKFDIAKIAYDTFESIEDIGEITKLEDSLKEANDIIFRNIADKTCEERDIDIEYFYDNLDSLFTPMAFLKYYDEVIEYYNNLYNLLPQIEGELNIDFNNRISAKDVYDGNEEELDESIQLNEEQSQEFLLVQKIIRKITELKKCFDELSEDEDILYTASEIYDLIDELPAFDEVQHKLHNINDWFYNAIEPLVKRDYPGDNYAISNEPFNEFFQYYPKPAKMYAKMLVNYLPRLEQLFKQDYLEDDEYNGSEEELDESYNDESNNVELDDTEQQIVDIINDYENCESDYKKSSILAQLYFICNETNIYNDPAIDFEQYLLDCALEDEDNMVYSTPNANEVDFDKLYDNFYSDLYNNTINLIEEYSNYNVKGLMEEIEEYCKKYLEYYGEDEDEDEEDINTLDESYDYDAIYDNIKEIYDELSRYYYSRMRDEEVSKIIKLCENSGYDELDDFITEFIDNMRSLYMNDSNNWGKEYDGDATYQKCIDIAMEDKIASYASSFEIEKFIDRIKQEIESNTNYNFDNTSGSSNLEKYEGDDTELDESVSPTWHYKVGDEVLEVKTGKIWVISEIEPEWVYVNRKVGKNKTIYADLIKIKDFLNEYEPLNKNDFKKYVYDGNEEELDESVSPSWHYEVGDRVVEKGGDVVWVIRYVEKYDIGLRRYAYGGVMTTSCPKDQFEEYYELLEQRDSKYMNYEGDDTELDESVNKKSTPFDKLLKLHKENPDIDIRTIANKVANGNIEEYISLMKQYYEKFEN